MPDDAIIPDTKLTRYLLVKREQDDKSNFLAQAGFTRDNPDQLKSAIRYLADTVEAVEDRSNEYGTFYRVKGQLMGVNNTNLEVITVWLNRKIDNQFQFITLIPNKE
ncbi:DUF6883 domain-containing protein [Coleofasciculus chthonoplastes]|uniref:DUF6883 domain-containing protein n=1 Tax=Coleofasciculus chthonoplastes TaxID=64178 RepID=UPI0005C45620